MLDRFLNSRWCIWIAALVGMLLVAPTINMGLMGDDYLHWSLLTGRSANPQPGSFYGLFTFANGNAQVNQAMVDSGQLVWWASDTLKIAFWRPLAELSQKLDYLLWPDSPAIMHIHNLILYGLMILLTGKLFLELETDQKQAGLATVLFSGNMLHVFAVAWLASRNQMLCGVLLVLTILAYHRWRQRSSALHGLLAALCLVLGLLSAEAAIQTVGYLVAYALFLEPGKPLGARLKALLPFILIVLAWKATHSHLGYGSFGSPGYIDPTSSVGRFAGSLVLRLPVLMAAQWLGVSSMMFEQLDRPTQYLYAGAATAALLMLGYLMARLGALRTPLARFYVLGAILSLVPACAGYPFDRLTVNADIGVSGMLALVLLSVWARRKQLTGWRAGSAKYTILLIGFVHLIIFPVATLASSIMMKTLNKAGEDMAALALPEADTTQPQHYLLLNPPAGEAVYYFPLTRQYHGMHNPTSMRALGPNNQAMTLSRVDDNTLRLHVPGGYRSTIARDARIQPFKAGDTARMAGIQVTVEAITADQVPATVLFRFPDSVQSPHWQFFAWQEDGVRRVQPPAVGQSIEIAAYDLGKAVMKQANKP